MAFGFVFVFLLLAVGGILALKSYRRLPAGCHAVRIRLGRPIGSAGPGGAIVVLPFLDQIRFVPAGEAPFRGKTAATLQNGLEIHPAYEGRFTIADPVAAYQGIPQFVGAVMPALQQLEAFATGALAAQLQDLVAVDDPEALLANRGRLAREWQHAANASLQRFGFEITSLSIHDLGLPPHLAAEWELRAYQQAGEPAPPAES